MPRKKLNSDPTPVYFRLQSQLLEEIENGQWEPGTAIPPERQLAESHQVSLGTVKKALMNLCNDGYLYRIQGKGTFVAGNFLRRENLRHYRAIREFGGKEGDLRIHFREVNLVSVMDPQRRALKLRGNQSVYELKRHFTINRRPTVFTKSYLPQRLCPGFEEIPPHRFEKITLYLILERTYGIPNVFNEELISVVAADEEVAGVLEVETGAPVLLLEMLAFTYKDRPYEYRFSYCRTDQRKIFREY